MKPKPKPASLRSVRRIEGVWGYVRVTLECGHTRWIGPAVPFAVELPCCTCLVEVAS
jgi:hypothetical protein